MWTVLQQLCLLSASALIVSAQSDPLLTIISAGYSSQLFTYSLDVSSGLLFLTNSQNVEENLTWMTFDKDSGNLYAIHEVDSYGDFGDSGAVSRWRLGADNITFEMQEVKSSEGTIPAHVEVDMQNRFLYISNYVGGNFVAYSLNADLSLGEVVLMEQFGAGSGVDPDRQNTSHIHQAARFGRFIYAVDMGSDRIYHYRITDDGASVERANPIETVSPPGSGPRHMTVVESERLAYVLGELKTTVDVYEIQEDSGELVHLATVDYIIEEIVPGTEQKGAEIAVHPNGQYLYISHRGFGAIVVFERASSAEGYLRQIQVQPTLGTTPRHFLVTPEGSCLVATARFDNKLETFVIGQDGMLSPGSVEVSEVEPAVIVLV